MKIEFYKRYRVMPHLLKIDEPKIFSKWVRFAKKNGMCPYFSDERFECYDFQCWLFDCCAGCDK